MIQKSLCRIRKQTIDIDIDIPKSIKTNYELALIDLHTSGSLREYAEKESKWFELSTLMNASDVYILFLSNKS